VARFNVLIVVTTNTQAGVIPGILKYLIYLFIVAEFGK
jgi:hypothetical protein